jgi:Tfp pilus assembly protein PilV
MRATCSRLRARCAARLASEEGFTLIEVLVAAVLIVLGIFGAVSTFAHSRRATTSSERIVVMVHLAQSEAEKIASTTYANVGLTAASQPSFANTGDNKDPLNYVTDSAPTHSYSYDWANKASTAEVFSTCTGTCTTFRSNWSDGRFSGYIYRFITVVNDGCTGCPGSDYKRISVVVTDGTTSPYPHQPMVYTTLMRDPS